MVHNAALLASYTANGDTSGWLGGVDAYIGQTQRYIRLVRADLDGLRNDEFFLARSTERFLKAAPRTSDALDRDSKDPVDRRLQTNYHACGIAMSFGEIILSLEQPRAAYLCEGAAIRTPQCLDALTKIPSFRDAFPKSDVGSACRYIADAPA